jgi:multiple sugar transport system permease protein/raffinose/stachyose/melibiose transport system permease protein
MAYLFVLPTLALYALFVLYPLVASVYLSLTEWDGASPVKRFVGLANYDRLVRDGRFWNTLSHNLIWIVVGTAVPIAVALLLAVLLWGRTRGYAIYRTVYFMPQVLPWVVVGIIWGWIYHPMFGVLNRALQAIGLGSLARGWLGNEGTALYAVLGAATWQSVGFVFVILLAGLQNVDLDLLDASRIDGANAWQRLWNVTIPQLANVLTLVTAVMLIGGFSVFDVIFVMTAGGPANSTDVIATYTYEMAFMQNQVGYSAALATVMTLVALVAAVVFVRLREREG